jgi:hypothetical protein
MPLPRNGISVDVRGQNSWRVASGVKRMLSKVASVTYHSYRLRGGMHGYLYVTCTDKGLILGALHKAGWTDGKIKKTLIFSRVRVYGRSVVRDKLQYQDEKWLWIR